MIAGAAVLAALVAAGDCTNDAPGLVAEAEALLSAAGHTPPSGARARARQLYRRARLLAPSPGVSLRAADLAAADGDFEEAGDLLSEAAESGPGLLCPADHLVLAARAEMRGRWSEAIAHCESLRDALAASGESADWIVARLARLRLEAEAQAIAAPSSSPPAEARLALADGKRALVAGRLAEARRKLKVALEIAPGYVEALLALGAVETRDNRAPEAIRAYRVALAAEPERFETLVALAGVLWGEPSRGAKQESLDLLERAAAGRPDLPALARLSALRWAEWGDAAGALSRLDAYRERVSEEERRTTDTLREALVRRVRGEPEGTAAVPAAPADVPTAAVEQWRKAQVYVQRGDPASLEAALGHLAEAERLDPKFARAPELEATIREKRSEWAEAEAALRRALRADPSRAESYERLARLLTRDPGRAPEAEALWRKADEAGSPEAAFALALAAERGGHRRRALAFLRRYRSESPGGVHADEAAQAQGRLERAVLAETGGAGTALVVSLAAGAVLLYRRRAGQTLGQWLAHDPGRAGLARPIVGRLRHEALKHGGLLLADAAVRLESGDRTARREAAALIVARLYGGAIGADAPRARGLIAESFRALGDLSALARETGVRLNLRYRDPIFARLIRGLAILRAAEKDLRRVASPENDPPPRVLARAAASLKAAAACFGEAAGEKLERILDDALTLPVRLGALEELLRLVAAEQHVRPPMLEAMGRLARGSSLLAVRVAPNDWETIWRNLFANALAAGRERGLVVVRLGLSVEDRRDPVTGERRLRLALADDVPGALTTEMICGRAADRGWGVVADLVRRHEGSIDVAPLPESPAGFVKSIVLDFPALEVRP